MLLKSEPINCIVSEDNPYSDMPMVCKVVLQVPPTDE